MFSRLSGVFDSEFHLFPHQELTLEEAVEGWKKLSDTVKSLVAAAKRVNMENKALKAELSKRTAELAECMARLQESEAALQSSLESLFPPSS